jgi:superfamily II DNA or RNA helicase
MRPLRSPQKSALENLMAAFDAGKRRVLLQAPCAFGKSLLAVYALSRMAERGLRPAIVAPRDTLVDQIGVDFIRDGVLDSTSKGASTTVRMPASRSRRSKPSTAEPGKRAPIRTSIS